MKPSSRMEPAERFKKIVGILGNERHTLSFGRPARIITNSVYARIPEKEGERTRIIFKHLLHEYVDSGSEANTAAERRLVWGLEAIPGVSAGNKAEITDRSGHLVSRAIVATHEASLGEFKEMAGSGKFTKSERDAFAKALAKAKKATGTPGQEIHVGYL